MIDFRLFRFDPLSHHLTNLWLHCFNVTLLFNAARQITNSTWLAAVEGIFFALIPMQIDTVAWVSQRRILLTTFFVLLAFYAMLRFESDKSRKWAIASFVSYILAILTYPIALPSGFILLWIAMRRRAQVPKWLAGCGLKHFTIIGLTLFFCAVTILRVIGASFDPLVTIGITSQSALKTLWNVFAFGTESPATDTGPVMYGWTALFATVGISSILFVGHRLGKRGNPLFLLGFVWFLSTALFGTALQRPDPFIPIHWNYLGLAGLAISVAVLCRIVLRSIHQGRLMPALLTISLLGVAFAGSREVGSISDPPKAFAKLFRDQPNREEGWRICQYFAMRLNDERRQAEAAQAFRRALTFRYDSRTLLHLGIIEKEKRHQSRAKLYFTEASQNKDYRSDAHNLLGTMAEETGDLAEAARLFALAVLEDQRNADAMISLAMIKAAASNPELRNGAEGLRLTRQAVKITGGGDLRAFSALAACHAELGDFTKAAALAKTALFWSTRLSGAGSEVAFCKERLQDYKEGKIWRIPKPTKPPIPTKEINSKARPIAKEDTLENARRESPSE